MIKEIYTLINGFLSRLKKDNVGAFSAQAAFFFIMSLFPFCSVLLTLIKYLPISRRMITKMVISVIPTPFEPIAKSILNELFVQSYSTTVLSLSVLIAIWAAGKAVMAIISGLNAVYHIEDKRNYLVLRIISSIYTIVLLIAILVSLLLLVFGNQIYYSLKNDSPVAADIISVFIGQKLILGFLILLLFFIMIYRLAYTRRPHSILLIPGSVFASASWILLSIIFSIYIDKFSNFSYTYGSLATLVLFMIWIYFCMYFLFIGAEINSYIIIFYDSIKHLKKEAEED